MSRVHLITPTLIPHDAVANDVFGMMRWLRLRGRQALAYAETIHPAFREIAQPVSAYQEYASLRNDVLIYHHSVGWKAGPCMFERSRNLKAIRYYSVTPSRFFRRYDPFYTELCLRGEMQTRELLRHRPDLLLAISEFTASELERAGADHRQCRIVPPFHAIGELESLEEDESFAASLRGRVNVVFVGRVAPNKGHRHLLRAFGCYRRRFSPDAQLYVVGKFEDRFSRFLAELQAEAGRNDLNGAPHFTGAVSASRLKAIYANASLFLCTSEHEGFCVPLVEAMYYGVPIVAFDSGAVGGTLGEDGLVWDTSNPALLAESMATVMTRQDVKERLVRQQRQRFDRHFTPEAIGRALDQALGPLLDKR